MSKLAGIQPFYFSTASLESLVEKYAPGYSAGLPYPHAVMDDFLPGWVIDAILEEYPDTGAIPWKQVNAPTENKKFSASRDEDFGPFTRHVMTQFNSAPFLKFLEKLTGIQGLIGDPYFLGGGLHQIQPGGFLKIHTDFNWHSALRLKRRLNVLLYLNKDWKEEYGGHFEMWDKQMTQCKKRVLPLANRCVVFSTTRFSYHGHPNPLTCPENRTRKSLAFYYYTVDRPSEQDYGEHGTLFFKRPDEKWTYLKNFLARCVPPIFYDLVIGVEKKLRRKS